MTEFLAKNRKEAKRIAKRKGCYVTGLGLADNQKNTRGKKRWVAFKKYK